MRYTFLIFVSLFIGVQLFAQAQLSGEVIFPKIKQNVKKGDGYNKDGLPVMHSNDPLANMNSNVIISVHPLSFQPTLKATADAYITQKQQTFIPHVLPIVKGTTVYLLNEDEFFHNIYSLTPGARFNIGRRPPGNPYPINIKRAGAITLSCDIHPHMKGIILSMETPFFVRVPADGKYFFGDLPAGKYRVEAYHPSGQVLSGIVELKEGQISHQNFDFSKLDKP